MSYIQFPTEESAETGQQLILTLGARVLAMKGYDIDEYGRPASAFKNGVKVPLVTERWDVPRQAVDGFWYVLAPASMAFYASLTPGRRFDLYSDLVLPTEGVSNDIVLQTGKAWLAEIWPLVGLGVYDDAHEPNFEVE